MSSLASLTRLSQPWHTFIEKTHQEVIYSHPSKTKQLVGTHDLAFLSESKSFAKYYDGTHCWKELCKRQTLLKKSWHSQTPTTHESVVQISNDAVWRFRPDFKRRIYLSTSQRGGVKVTCMDTGELLWHIAPGQVRPYAHLEYHERTGTAVWDRYENALEVWRVDDNGPRGSLMQVAVLQHDCETRGYQFSHDDVDTLCVVSTEGQAFVYDMTTSEAPQLKTRMEIEQGAIGHLDQNKDMVMFSLGKKGYHIHSKATGEKLGVIQPKFCKRVCHIKHPHGNRHNEAPTLDPLSRHGPTPTAFPPQYPRNDTLIHICVEEGCLPGPLGVVDPIEQVRNSLEDDEWGAGMLSGDLMVGISRGGRVLICTDWRRAMTSNAAFVEPSTIIERKTEEREDAFDLGGWLSIRKGIDDAHRILFEVKGQVYILALNDDLSIPTPTREDYPSFAFATSSIPELAVPVSFMALYDDCIMLTYATLGAWREAGERVHGERERARRPFPTKCIKILSLAPDLDDVSFAGAHEGVDTRDERLLERRLYAAAGDEQSDRLLADAMWVFRG